MASSTTQFDQLSLSSFITAADQGDKEAQYHVAICYRRSLGVERDDEASFRYLKKSADQQFVAAEYYISNYYDNGIGTQKDEQEAFRYRKLAADQGHTEAQYQVACAYKSGTVIQLNEREAFNYFKLAAEGNYKDAQYHLALCYQNGFGTPKNDVVAVTYLKLAADQNHTLALHNLVYRYQIGRGVEKNLEMAKSLHRKATSISIDHLPSQWTSEGETISSRAPSFLLKVYGKNGYKSLAQHILSPNVDLLKSHIPLHPPLAKEQRGHTCGLYALGIALALCHPDQTITPARKNDIKPTANEKKENQNGTSLRQIAKQHKLTVIGEIYDIYNLEKIAKIAGFERCAVFKSSREKYIDDIKKSIQTGHSVILPADNEDGFPGNTQAKRLHYALAWGYIFKDNQYYFLVTQFGKYFLWSADALQRSHEQMPDHIDRQEFYKDHKRDNYYPLQPGQEIKQCDFRETPASDLSHFQFAGLAVPVANKAYLKLDEVTEEEKASVSPAGNDRSIPILSFLFKINKKVEAVKNIESTLTRRCSVS